MKVLRLTNPLREQKKNKVGDEKLKQIKTPYLQILGLSMLSIVLTDYTLLYRFRNSPKTVKLLKLVSKVKNIFIQSSWKVDILRCMIFTPLPTTFGQLYLIAQFSTQKDDVCESRHSLIPVIFVLLPTVSAPQNRYTWLTMLTECCTGIYC